jgi:hypothetical protein
MNFLRARSAAPGGDGFPITNIEAEVVAGAKGREANYGVDRSAPRCAMKCPGKPWKTNGNRWLCECRKCKATRAVDRVIRNRKKSSANEGVSK